MSQNTIVLPVVGPKTAAEFAALINLALQAIQSQNSGSSSPTNGPAAAPVPFQIWADASGAPSVVFKHYDGVSWVPFGRLDTAAHSWTPIYRGSDVGTVVTANIDTDVALAANSDARVASQKATKAYVDQIIAAQDAMVFKGVIDCSANPNYPAADRGWTYRVSVAGKVGGASGVVVEVGDLLICLTDGTASGTQAAVGAQWTVTQANIDGAVVGPASAVSANFPAFNGTTGKLLADSGKAVPSGAVVGTSDTQTLTGKTIDTASNTLKLNGAAFGTAAQATAALNPFVGDTGTGGTKGIVPAPGAGDGAAKKALLADGTFGFPGGGGGGALSDTDRQNALLDRIWLAKQMGGRRAAILAIAEGFKDSAGINIGGSSNYTLDTSGGRVQPSMTSPTDQIPTMSSGTTSGVTMSASSDNGANFAWNTGDKNNGTYWQSGGAPTQWLKVDFGSAKTIGSYTIRARNDAGSGNAPGTFTLQGSATGAFLGEETTLDTRSGQTYTAGEVKSFSVSSPTSFRYYRINTSVTALNSAVALAELTMLDVSLVNSMTVVTAVQTSDAAVSNARVLLEFDNTSVPALNTDLTVEVTCNGGTNWMSASLSSVSAYGQGGRKIVETVDQACTSGTSFAARIKTFNGKSVTISGVSLTVH